jgi:hypothetical protein
LLLLSQQLLSAVAAAAFACAADLSSKALRLSLGSDAGEVEDEGEVQVEVEVESIEAVESAAPREPSAVGSNSVDLNEEGARARASVGGDSALVTAAGDVDVIDLTAPVTVTATATIDDDAPASVPAAADTIATSAVATAEDI